MRFRLRDRVEFNTEDGVRQGTVVGITHALIWDTDEEDTTYRVKADHWGYLSFAGWMRDGDVPMLRHAEVPVGTRVLLKYDDPNRENREANIQRVRYRDVDHEDVYNTPIYLLRFDDGQSVETGAERFEVVL